MTIANIRESTFLQKLLGRNYKWWYLLSHSFRSYNTHRMSSLSAFFARFIALLSVLLIWYVALQNSATYNFQYIFTYYLVGNIFSFFNTVQWAISNSIKDGKLATLMLRPSSIWLQWYITNLGWNLFVIFSETLLTLIVLIVGFKYIILPPDIFSSIIFIIVSLVGYISLVFTNFLFGFSAFFMHENWGVMELSSVTHQYASGKTFPLNLIWFIQPLAFLPSAFNFYHPMQIYLGKYDTTQTIWVFIGGIAWCVVLYFLAKLTFKLGLKRNEGVGL